MDIIKLSIKRPSVLIVMLSLLLLGGFYSYKLLNYELIPKFEVNVITISTIYAGASPSEIESTVTRKLKMRYLLWRISKRYNLIPMSRSQW